MQKFLLSLLLSFLFASDGWAQQTDTVFIRRIQALEGQVDSLLKVIHLMDSELQRLKEKDNEKKSSEDEFLAPAADQESAETIPEDQRSRHKEVDDLLNALTQRPGQLRLNGAATASLQGHASEENHNTSGVGSFDFFATTSFDPHSLLFIDLEAIGGNGLDEIFSTLSGLNEDAGSTQDDDGFDRITVLEAWAELSILNEIFTITAGKIDLTNYFDNNASANDETSQFLSSAFVNSAAFAVPNNSPGIRVRTTLLNRFYVQFGLASMENSGLNLLDELYKIGSMGFRIFPHSRWEGNLRLYAYQHPVEESALGYGLSFDQGIFGAHIFGRYGQNDDKIADWFGISSGWSAGTSFAMRIADRETVLGIGYSEINPRGGELENEKLLEIYFRHQLNKWVHVSPNLQVVWNAAGLSEDLTILGIRTHFSF